MNAFLPDELQALKALVPEQQDPLAAREIEIAAREAEIEPLKLLIASCAACSWVVVRNRWLK